MSDRWQLLPGSRPAWRSWGDEFVVHHALSNDTHRLSADAGRLLCELQAHGPVTVEDLAQACDQSPQDIVDMLNALAEHELVVSC